MTRKVFRNKRFFDYYISFLKTE